MIALIKYFIEALYPCLFSKSFQVDSSKTETQKEIHTVHEFYCCTCTI